MASTCDASARSRRSSHGDAGWLERLLLNLLDNAIKFTPAGGCIVVARVARRRRAPLEVRDNGIGMSPEVAAARLRPFLSRRSRTLVGATEGAGLGLSLVKWIVDRHDGTIAVTSQPAGSTFTVRLP